MSKEITYIVIYGHRIGIIGLPDVIEEVKQLKLDNETVIPNELLERIKQHNYVPDSRIEEYGRALLREYKKSLGLAVEDEKLTETSIRILGPGCPACEKMEQDVKSILVELNIAADVQHVRDVNEIAEYGIVRTPSLVINNKIVLNGRSLPKSQLKTFVHRELNL